MNDSVCSNVEDVKQKMIAVLRDAGATTPVKAIKGKTLLHGRKKPEPLTGILARYSQECAESEDCEFTVDDIVQALIKNNPDLFKQNAGLRTYLVE